jgi:hypothetical protein
MNLDPNLLARDVTLSRYVVPESRTQWSVRKYRYFGGKQEKMDILWVDNGKIQIALLATRGMGILKVLKNGEQVLGWDSPVKEVVHPNFINLNSRGGLGWLEGFNEWLCRCGMEWNGHPGVDEFIDNKGEKATMNLTLHGRVANLPAQEVMLIAERDPPYRITIRGTVDERMFHGPKLELTTEFSTIPGTSSFRIADAVSNRGGERQEFQMLYHVNFGPPMLEEGARFLAPVEIVTPMNGHAAKDVDRYDQYAGPAAGFVEQVYLLKPLADNSGQTLAVIQNKAGNRAASIRFDTHQLPFLTLWKNTAAVEDGYVTGIEPGTNYPNNRAYERRHGRVPSLSPGESHFMTLEFAIHEGVEEVQQATQEVMKLQQGRKPLINREPEKDVPENKGGPLREASQAGTDR